MGNLIIVESELEPNKWNLWFKQGVIRWFGPNGWEPINTKISKLSINEHSLNIKNNIPDLFNDRSITVNSFICENSQVTSVTPVIEFIDSSIVAVENIWEESPGVYKVSFLGLKEGSTFAVITGAEGNQKLINIVVSGISNTPYSKYIKVKFEDRRSSYEDIINFHLNVSKDKTLPFKTDSNKPFNEETILNIREGEYSTTGYNIVDVEALIDGSESNHYNIELTYSGQKYGNTYYLLSENEENVITAVIEKKSEESTTTTTTLPPNKKCTIIIEDNRSSKKWDTNVNVKLDDFTLLDKDLNNADIKYTFKCDMGVIKNTQPIVKTVVTTNYDDDNTNGVIVSISDFEGNNITDSTGKVRDEIEMPFGVNGDNEAEIYITLS